VLPTTCPYECCTGYGATSSSVCCVTASPQSPTSNLTTTSSKAVTAIPAINATTTAQTPSVQWWVSKLFFLLNFEFKLIILFSKDFVSVLFSIASVKIKIYNSKLFKFDNSWHDCNYNYIDSSSMHFI
jgi:hypothetical protein